MAVLRIKGSYQGEDLEINFSFSPIRDFGTHPELTPYTERKQRLSFQISTGSQYLEFWKRDCHEVLDRFFKDIEKIIKGKSDGDNSQC